MKCLCCKNGEMTPGTNTYFSQTPGGCYIIIENVPCMKCEQCGEVVYNTAVIEKVDEITEKIEAMASKVMIMDFSRAS